MEGRLSFLAEAIPKLRLRLPRGCVSVMPHGLKPILAVAAALAGVQHMTIQMVMINDDFFIICVGYTNWRRLLSVIRQEYLHARDGRTRAGSPRYARARRPRHGGGLGLTAAWIEDRLVV